MFGSACRTPWLVVVLGMAALHLVSFIGALSGLLGQSQTVATAIVMAGWAIKLVAYLLGLGALVYSRFGAKPAAA
jgi:hypothetical protein